jgi:hypothetical protein
MAAGDPGVLKRNFSATAIETTLVNSISSAATGDTTTSVSVVSVSGYPAAPFTLIFAPDTNKEEVVTCISVVGTTLQVVRGQDSTLAVAHTAGTSVRHGVSGRDFKEEQTHIAARGYDADSGILSNAGQTHVHGLETGDGSVVGSTQAVLLTRKTLGTGTSISSTVDNSSGTISGGTITSTTVTASTVRSSTLTNDTLGSDLAAGGYVVTGLGAPVNANDSTRKAYVDAILGSATAAATSATSAATSATSAATSATSAAASASASASSASAAATSASSALTSQTAAATSATSAAASATAAATSATSAAASATAAATSATSAAASATTAAASVATIAGYSTSAANSASAAATSATSAEASATAAATSAASAATSASTMAASVTAAATSATSAAASATAAATSATSAAASATAAATSATSAATSASSALTSQTAAATSAADAATSASSAATTYDNFDDRYLGAKSTAPTVDNDGNPLITGAMYFNSVTGVMAVWSGTAWVAINTTSSYSAPTLGSTLIPSGTTVTTLEGVVDIVLTGPGSIKDELTLLLMEAL